MTPRNSALAALVALLTSLSVHGQPVLKPAWTVVPGDTAGNYINSVAISGDGARVVAGTFFHDYSTPAQTADPADARRHAARKPSAANGNGDVGMFGIYCYDRNGKPLWKDAFIAWEGFYWVDISTDGAWAAGGGWFSKTPLRGFVRAYNAATGNLALNYPTTARVNQVALSADGTWLVSAANTIVLFQRAGTTFQKADEYTSPSGSDTMETIALSADGRTLVVGDYAGTILLFRISGGKLGQPTVWKLPGGGYSHSVRITPNGTAFAAGGSRGNFYLFDVAQFLSTGAPTVTYTIPNAGSIYGVAISDDAAAFVGIANVSGGTGRVYCVQRQGTQGTLMWTFPTLHNPNSASFNSRANLIAIADGHPDGQPGAFYVVNAATGTLLGQCPTGNMSWPIEISANGSAIVGGSDDSNVYYFAAPFGTAAPATNK